MAQIVIIVIDAQDTVSDQDLHLLGIAADSGKSLIIAINKWDGLDRDQKNTIRNQLDRKIDFINYACVHYISALHGTGVGKLFDLIDKIGKSQAIRVKSSMVTDILHEVIQAHEPPLVRGRRIKLRYAHVGGHDPLRIIIHGNQTEHVPDNYRRYLSNKIRQRLQLFGTPVMIEFKHGNNPYKGRKNVLSKRQIEKRKRLMKHVKSRKYKVQSTKYKVQKNYLITSDLSLSTFNFVLSTFHFLLSIEMVLNNCHDLQCVIVSRPLTFGIQNNQFSLVPDSSQAYLKRYAIRCFITPEFQF